MFTFVVRYRNCKLALYEWRRVDYFYKLRCPVVLPPESPLVRDHAIPRKQKVYYFDTYEFLRWFPQDYHWGYCPGDVTFIPDCPALVKGGNAVARDCVWSLCVNFTEATFVTPAT